MPGQKVFMKRVPVTPGIEGKEGGGRNKLPEETSPATAAAPCSAGAIEEQRRMLSLCTGQSMWLWPPAFPTSQLSRNKVSLGEVSVCAGIWQESNTSSPAVFQAQPACVLGDPHLTAQSLKLLQFPMALPHHFVPFPS